MPTYSLPTPTSTIGGLPKVRRKPLFWNERFYIDATEPDLGRIEQYIKFSAGGRIVERSQSKFIILSYEPDLARAYAENIPEQAEGEKMIRFDWIKESVESGYILSRKSFWAIPRGDLVSASTSTSRTERSTHQKVTRKRMHTPPCKQVESSSLDRYQNQEEGIQHRLQGGVQAQFKVKVDQKHSSESNSTYYLNKRDDQKIENPEYKGKHNDANKHNRSCDNNSDSDGQTFDHLDSKKGIFRNLTFWIVGSPKQRISVEQAIMSESGNIIRHLWSADVIVFYPPERGFLPKAEDCHRRAEASFKKGARCLAYTWIDDCVSSKELLDEKNYIVGKRDLDNNGFWDRMVNQQSQPPPPPLSSSPPPPPPSVTPKDDIQSVRTSRKEVGNWSGIDKKSIKVPPNDLQGPSSEEARPAALLQQISSKVDKAPEVERNPVSSTVPESTEGEMLVVSENTSQADDRYPTPVSPISIDYPSISNHPESPYSPENQVPNLQQGNSEHNLLPLGPSVATHELREDLIFNGLIFWLIGPHFACVKLSSKIRALGGIMGNDIDGSSRIIFCRCPARYRIQERMELFEKAKQNHGLVLDETWVHDVDRAGRLLDHKNYEIQSKAVLEDVYLWERMIPWNRLDIDGPNFAHLERNGGEDRIAVQVNNRYHPLTGSNGEEDTERSLLVAGSRVRSSSTSTSDVNINKAAVTKSNQAEIQFDIHDQSGEEDMELDDFADLAGLFSTDEEDIGRGDEKDSTVTPALEDKSEDLATDGVDSSVMPPPCKRGRPRGSFKKPRNIPSTIDNQVLRLSPIESESDTSNVAPLKRVHRSSRNVRKNRKRNIEPSSDDDDDEYDDNNVGSGTEETDFKEKGNDKRKEKGASGENVRKRKRPIVTSVSATSQARYDRIKNDLKFRLESGHGFPKGIQRYLDSIGELSFYRYYVKLFRQDLPDLPWGNRPKED